MNNKLRISVVVATYNRADTLRETICHLNEQKLDPKLYEVIIVDDGSIDETGKIVKLESQKVSFHLKYLHHPNKGPGYTQNRGIREARAPIILLIADDIFLTDSALKEHLDYHEQNPEDEVAVLGRVLQSPGLDQSVFLKHWKPFRFSDFHDYKELPYYMFWACNISFKKAFMTEYGMFRDKMGRFGPAAHEDVELGYRLYQHGLKIYYNQGALGYHHHVGTLEGAFKRSYQRGLNWREFYELIRQPELAIRYRTYNLFMLVRSIRDLKGPRLKYMIGQDRSIALLIYRYLMRLVVFNRLTIPYILLPVLNYAERNTFLARYMHDRYYRGAVVYYFLKGCRDEKRWTGSVDSGKIDFKR